MIVMKFGGSSVADRSQIEKVLEIVKGRLPRRPLVVSSAHKGMTDKLINAAKAAAKRNYDLPDVIDYQQEIAASLGCPGDLLSKLLQEIGDLLRGIGLVREISPRSLDYIASFGERLAVRCIADFFTRQGVKAQAYDVWDLGFITDANFGNARPLPGYEEKVRQAVAALPPDVVPVVTGFIGRTEQGDITTVGRNGSDLTATLLGAALRAEEVEIWTDTDGVMSADPSLVSEARNIPHMCFEEAAELAYFGSRVLHPETLLPAMERDIPVRVLNTNHPWHPGTRIDREGPPDPKGFTSIAYKENQVVLNLTSSRMFQQVGFLAKIFGALARHGVVVDVIATSEIRVSLTTDKIKPIEAALPELRQLGECEIKTGKTILAVVARKLAKRREQIIEIMDAVSRSGASIEMLSFGLGSINFSLVVDDKDIAKAVPLLHHLLFNEH